MDEIRLDKWLWAVRLFKTRTQASEACRSGKIVMGDAVVKASRTVRLGDEVEMSVPPIVRRFRVLGLAEKRVGAALARNLVEEITTAEDLEKLRRFRQDPRDFMFAARDKGSGRPTKRERRQTERLRDGSVLKGSEKPF